MKLLVIVKLKTRIMWFYQSATRIYTLLAEFKGKCLKKKLGILLHNKLKYLNTPSGGTYMGCVP